MAQATIIKKITSRTVGCEAETDQSFVVYGKVMRATPMESQFGPYVKFGGQFMAVNEIDGKQFRSAVFLAPGIAEDQIYSALQTAQELSKSASAEFALRFKTVEDKKSARGYIWVAETLIEPESDDPLERLTRQISGDVPKLAPPAKKAKKEAA